MTMTVPGYADITMGADAKVALAWLQKLERQLDVRNKSLMKYDRYYRGDHPLLFATTKFREAFAGLFKEFADNWTELVVDAVEERLDVEGFRFPGSDQAGEKKAWSFWQTNQLDADSQLAHTEALINGMAYTLVWPSDGKAPLICVEDPQEMIVAHAAGDRRCRQAAVKIWADYDAEKTFATVYLPSAVWKFQRSTLPVPQTGPGAASGWFAPATMMATVQQSSWAPRVVDGEDWPLANPMGVVPVVPLYNKPRIRGEGASEIRGVIPMQDATNKLLADMMVASEFAAFRQRWATGLEIPNNPETQRPQEPFEHAINRLWTSPSKDTTFGEFGASDLTNYTKAIELIVQHVASQTRTPPHYFYLSGQFPSGESIKSAETGLVAKTHRKQRHFGEAWEETIRLAFLASGDTKRSAIEQMETVWRDPESRSEGEHIDATIKLKALGVPLIALWERAGFSPTQIDRFKELKLEEAQFADPAAALVPTPPPGTRIAPGTPPA